MSVYAGFASRHLEARYNKALYNTLFLLQLRISKLFKGGKTYLPETANLEKFDDIKFGKVLTKLYARLYSMEEVKHLPPKFSHSMKDLTSFLGIFEITEDELKK